MIIFWCPPGVWKLVFFSLPITLQPLGTHKAIIYEMKGDIHSSHMRHISMSCPMGLQRYGSRNFLNRTSLVSVACERARRGRENEGLARAMSEWWQSSLTPSPPLLPVTTLTTLYKCHMSSDLATQKTFQIPWKCVRDLKPFHCRLGRQS